MRTLNKIVLSFAMVLALGMYESVLGQSKSKYDLDFTITDMNMLRDRNNLLISGFQTAHKIFDSEKEKLPSLVIVEHDATFSSLNDSLEALAPNSKRLAEIKNINGLLKAAKYGTLLAALKMDLVETLRRVSLENLNQHVLGFFEKRKNILKNGIDFQKVNEDIAQQQDLINELKMDSAKQEKKYNDITAVFIDKYGSQNSLKDLFIKDLEHDYVVNISKLDSLEKNRSNLLKHGDELESIRRIGSVLYLTAMSNCDYTDILLKEIGWNLRKSAQYMFEARDLIVKKTTLNIYQNTEPFLTEREIQKDNEESDIFLELLQNR